MDAFKTILIFVILSLIYILLDFMRLNIYQRLKFKTKEFTSDPSKVGNVISLVLAAISIGLTFSDMGKITQILGDYVVQIIMLFLIIIILTLFLVNTKNEKILSLEQQLQSETKGIWKEYGELNKFQKDKILQNLMEIFVRRHNHVSSVQRYRYSIYEQDEHTVISLHGVNHYINEGYDLNTVSQAYFKFNNKQIQELKEAKAKSSISSETKNKNHDDYGPMQNFFITYANELFKKNIEEYKDEDALTFSLLEIAYEALLKKYGDFNMPLSDDSIKRLQRKKSGLYIAVVLLQNKMKLLNNKELIKENYYKGDSDNKKLRYYTNIEVENEIGEQYVFVLCHHADKLWSEDERLEQFKTDAYKFVELIGKQSYSIRNN